MNKQKEQEFEQKLLAGEITDIEPYYLTMID